MGEWERRGQSSVLGVVLVLAIVIAGSTLTLALGAEAFASTNNQLQSGRAQQSMTQLDSQIALVGLGSSDLQEVPIPSAGGYTVKNQSGWMNIIITNMTSGDKSTVLNQTMGAVVYENGETTIAYQGGGVWRQTAPKGSTMISPPEFHYREATLTLPLVSVRGDESLDSSAVVNYNSTIRHFPDQDRGFTNPLENGRVTVTVQSAYYRAWGSYFEERTDGEVEYDHDDQRVKLHLTIPAEYPSVKAGVISGAPGSTMVINNNAGLDSYNSSVAPYNGDLQGGSPTPDSTDAKIKVAGDLEIEKGDVYGDVVVGGDLRFTHNNGELHDGNISYAGTLDPSDPYGEGHWNVPDPSTSKFWRNQNASVTQPDSVTGIISERRSVLSDPANNNNSDEDDIDETTNELDCSADCTIEKGAYFIESATVTNDLTFNTSDGDIDIVVNGSLDIQSNMVVKGDGRVNMYVTGSVSTATSGVQIGNTSTDDSTQFWLYVPHDESVTLDNNAQFRGVVYGPGAGNSAGVTTNLGNNAEVYGAIVGELRIQSNNAAIHYDAALADADTVVKSETLPALTYIHASTNYVNVTSG